MTLTDEHINYIVRDIAYRGIVDDDLGEELVDHICSLVEERMADGQRFIEAYDNAIKEFENITKLSALQNETIQYSNNNTKIMIKNYFKIAFRNLTKHKFYAAINITGLAIGLACTLLIYLFVSNELDYDNFHKDGDRIYRLVREGRINGTDFKFALGPAPFAHESKLALPKIEQSCRFRSRGTYLVRKENGSESFKESRLIFTDSTFFDMFSFPLVHGNEKNALIRPKTIAISESVALKYFGTTDVLGNVLVLDNDQKYEITAVFVDMPNNSHLQFDFLMSLSSLERSASTSYLSNNNYFTYFKLREGVTPNDFIGEFTSFYESKSEPELEKYLGFNMEEFRKAGNEIEIWLQPMEDIYLDSDFSFDLGTMGSRDQVHLFIAVALFILGLACINFMNLSTARSANRAKEVGIRKALGSVKIHLIRQFLLESIIMSFIAIAAGLVVVVIALPLFNDLSARSLSIPFTNPLFIISILALAIVIGVLAGVYPAFYLSSFRPINTLKGKLSLGTGNSLLRSGLVVFQFFISILLIIGTIAIHKQLNFIQNKKVGFDKKRVLLVNDTYMLGKSKETFKNQLVSMNDVISASYSGFIPVNGYHRNDNTYWRKELAPDESNMVSTQIWTVDHDYLNTLGMTLIKGREFNKNIASDSSAIILNQEAAKRFNITDIEDATYIRTFYGINGKIEADKYVDYKVIGIIEDFHFESLKQEIAPVALRLGTSSGVLSLKLNSSEYSEIIGKVEDVWSKFAGGLPFNYQFLDDQFDRMYRDEQRLGRVFAIFAGLAIFIGCMGLFALATFMAEQRIKEIGIRKVLGASVQSVVFMLSKQFTKLVIVSFILAVPIAWYALDHWLNNYNYKISPGFEIFAIAGFSAFCIAWLTVSYQALKAAVSNPVDSLKNE